MLSWNAACHFVEPIAAHDLNIFLFDTSLNANFEVFVKSTAVYDALLREGGQEVAMQPLDSQLIAIGEHGCILFLKCITFI